MTERPGQIGAESPIAAYEPPLLELTLHEGRAVEIALQHGLNCICSNCMAAVFAVQRIMAPFKAVGSPRDEDVKRIEDELARIDKARDAAIRRLALLGVDG